MRGGLVVLAGGLLCFGATAGCGGASASEPWMIPVRGLSAPPADQRCDAASPKRFMVILQAREDEGSSTDGRLSFVVDATTMVCRRAPRADGPTTAASPRWSPRTPAKVEATFYTPDNQLERAATFADWEVSFVETPAPERNAQLQLWQGGGEIVSCRWRNGQPTSGTAKVPWAGRDGNYSGSCTLSPWP